ncbi:hypothetical protein CFP56_039693 [Quercus suber]|uniref:Uncharacterized protein n=1 Tax=Quercus suber TaxID=58331 RepID=A0AAW0M8J8_QUESU
MKGSNFKPDLPKKSVVVVIGDGVDSVSLASSLREKLASTTIESVQEVKAESAEKKDPTILRFSLG